MFSSIFTFESKSWRIPDCELSFESSLTKRTSSAKLTGAPTNLIDVVSLRV